MEELTNGTTDGCHMDKQVDGQKNNRNPVKFIYNITAHHIWNFLHNMGIN